MCHPIRLAPASGPLTEAAFAKHPLDFVGPSVLRWDGDPSTQMPFNATTVSGDATFPRGSQWRRNPIPRSPTLWSREGPSFEPVCEESAACKGLVDPSEHCCCCRYHDQAWSGRAVTD
jgi:hypothetical protein